jgi:DNA-directed RNA polymerase subunit RPC12/RpoP
MAEKKGKATGKSAGKTASKKTASKKTASKGGAKSAKAPGSTGVTAEETHKPASGAPGSGRSTPARSNEEASGEELRREMASPIIPSVTTMVCLTCGAEQFFDGQVPGNLKCQRCGSMVFRTFDTPTERNEATIAHLEEEARSVQYGDPSPTAAAEEVRELDMGDR